MKKHLFAALCLPLLSATAYAQDFCGHTSEAADSVLSSITLPTGGVVPMQKYISGYNLGDGVVTRGRHRYCGKLQVALYTGVESITGWIGIVVDLNPAVIDPGVSSPGCTATLATTPEVYYEPQGYAQGWWPIWGASPPQILLEETKANPPDNRTVIIWIYTADYLVPQSAYTISMVCPINRVAGG